MRYVRKLVILIFSFLILSSSSVWAEKKVTLQLRWDYQYQFAGYLTAKWMGYYSQEGLDVEIKSAITPQNEILSAITEVKEGRAQFGIGAADVLIAKDKGIPLVLLLTIFQQSSAAFYALPDTHVDSLADFTRLKVTRRVNDLIDVELQAMLKSEGIDPKKVTPYEHATGVSNLLDGEVDIVPGYSISMPYELLEAGITPRVIKPSQYGVDFYGDSLFTTEDVIKSDPDMVEGFMLASRKGWEYALDHPQEIAARIATELPRTAPVHDVLKFNSFQAKGVRDLTLYPVVELGHINADRWNKIHHYLKETGLVKNEFDPLKFIYNPAKSKLAAEKRFELVIFIGLGVTALVLVIALLLVHLLRRTVSMKTKIIAETRKSFDLAMEASQDGLYDWNIITNEIYYSPGWKKMLGYEVDELPNDFSIWENLTAPEDVQRSWELQQELINKVRDHFEMEFKMKHKEGHWVDILSRAKVIFNAGGKAIRMVGTHVDITARKRYEESLRRSEERLQEAHNLAKVGSWEFDLRTGDIWGSDEGFEIYGMETPPANMLSVDDIEACIFERERVHQALVDLVNEGKPYDLEFDIQPADGSAIKHIISKAKVEQDSKGNPIRVYGVVQDITELKQSQLALVKSEAYLREVVTKTPHPMAILNSTYTEILFYNDSFTKTFGYTLDDISTPDEWWEIVYPDPEYRTIVQEAWLEAVECAKISNEEIAPQEWRMRRKDGEFRDAEFTLMPLDKEFLICVTDLTEHRALVTSLKKAKEMAEAANLAKSTFLANMSHEIRTPLNGIMGMLQLLKMTTLDETQQEYASIGIESSKRLTSLLSDILDLSMVEAGKIQIQSEPFQLEKAIREVMQLFLPSANQTGVELRLQFDSTVPAWVMGDKVRLQQIFTNLIGNALKFTNAGSVTIEACILASPRHEYVRILFSVVDTGIGISEEVSQILFEPFIQGSENFRRGQHGAGLGLSICKRLIGMMDGDISAESELGKGASFYFSIPFIVAKSQALCTHILADGEDHAYSSIRVLLADDDKVNLLASGKLLENIGCIVKSVINGAEAIDTLREGTYDLVFMDVQMPIMDGIEATQLIRRGEAGEDLKGIPIIAMTAYAMSGDKEKFLDAGMTAYIAKPATIQSLKEAIKLVLPEK